MFKKFIALMVVVATTLSGCSIDLPFINSAKADDESFVIENYEGYAELSVKKVGDNEYIMEAELTKKGAKEYFGDDYGKATGIKMIITMTKEGYDETVADLIEDGYDVPEAQS